MLKLGSVRHSTAANCAQVGEFRLISQHCKVLLETPQSVGPEFISTELDEELFLCSMSNAPSCILLAEMREALGFFSLFSLLNSLHL